MKPFSTLFTKILVYLIANLLLVTALLVAFIVFQSRLDLRTLLGRWASDRLRITAEIISHDLSRNPPQEWQEILTRHKEINSVDFALVTGNGVVFVSEGLSLPKEVVKRAASAVSLRQLGRLPDIPPMNKHFKRRLPGNIKNPPGDKRFIMNTDDPVMHWMGAVVLISPNDKPRPMPAMLIAGSDSITGNGFFFEPMPWIIAAALVILISVVLWIPLVRHITKPLGRMTVAAEEIAKGKFDVSLHVKRSDEIGRLSESINHMTARLRGYVKGQKRFLRDVAHELSSPIARIQFGIGILEQHVDEENADRLEDVAEDVAHLSNLVNEILSFSKADIIPQKITLETFELAPVAQKIAHREGITSDEIVLKMPSDLQVTANRDLLSRALSNLIRNAVAYSGQAGPILITTEKKENTISIEVRDSGPGVPEHFLDKIFEPFFRPESSRDPVTGGVGLGLSIVKTCMDACGGTVSARNILPRGFSVTLSLPTKTLH